MHDTPEYHAWEAARQRCTNPKNPMWYLYGGRGIRMRFRTFDTFFKAVGPRPSRRYVLDRKDNDGHYQRGNVRWVTHSESLRNRRSYRRYTVRCVVCGQTGERARRDSRYCSQACIRKAYEQRVPEGLKQRRRKAYNAWRREQRRKGR